MVSLSRIMPYILFCRRDASFLLPQLIPADSFAFKLRHASEERNVFVKAAYLNLGGISFLGLGTFFIPAWPQLICDSTAVLGTLGVVSSCSLTKHCPREEGYHDFAMLATSGHVEEPVGCFDMLMRWFINDDAFHMPPY